MSDRGRRQATFAAAAIDAGREPIAYNLGCFGGTALQLGKGKFARSVPDGIDGCLRLGKGRRIQNCPELFGALQAKRTDPEALPFRRRFPGLNRFTRARLRPFSEPSGCL